MSQFPSAAVKQKANEILGLLDGMTVADIYETLALAQTYVGTFAGQQVYGRMAAEDPRAHLTRDELVDHLAHQVHARPVFLRIIADDS